MHSPCPSPSTAVTRRGLLLAAAACVLPARAAAVLAPTVVSEEHAGRARAEVEGWVGSDFSLLRSALAVPAAWCDILVLPAENDACALETPEAPAAPAHLRVEGGTGRVGMQPFTLRLALEPPRGAASGLEARLSAAHGPYGTSDYAIDVRLQPAPAGTRVALALACRVGLAGRMALQAYLSVLAREKVGFSRRAGGSSESDLVGGLRGLVERTAMRYYLALEAWSVAAALPPAQQREARARHWIAAAARYPRQLREPPRDAYLQSKRILPAR